MLRGRHVKGHGVLLQHDDETKLSLFQAYLARFPGDAAYHGLKPSRKVPHDEDLLRSVLDEVTVVEVSLR